MILVNRKWPELEELLKDYTEWYSLASDHDREQWEIDHGCERFGKIWVIKKIRTVTGTGLREAKILTEVFEKSHSSDLWNNAQKAFLSNEERNLLETTGFTFESTKINKSRMLRVGEKTVNVGEIKYCQCPHSSKSVEWRVVGEYKIDIAKYCPECGKYFLVGG